MLKTNQNGRSMVEMLGVLAIVGVLSVTGIIGYTIAMRKYRANEIAQAISSMAIAAKTANGGLGIEDTKNYIELLKRQAGEEPVGVNTLRALAEGSPQRFANKIELVTNNKDLCLEVASIIGDSSRNALYIKSGDEKCSDGEKITVTVND